MQFVNGWFAFPAALLIFGFFPGLFARLISLCFRKDDPRRQELIAEVYGIPRLERPMWVAEQFERALSEGIWERLWDAADGRLFNRWHLGDGIAYNLESPDTFFIPSREDIDFLVPGDVVKLIFEANGRTYGLDGCNGERMWVKVTKINGDSFEGKLSNHPAVWGNLYYGDKLKFTRKHIIDFDYVDADENDAAA